MEPNDLSRFRECAVRAVQRGMQSVQEWPSRRASPATVDELTEEIIVASLRGDDEHTPIISELSGGDMDVDRAWVVDPVDGTDGLLRGSTFVSVTVALVDRGRPIVGATGCPFTGEVWSAARHQGACDNSGRRLRVRERPAARRRIVLDPEQSNEEQLALWERVRRQLAAAFPSVETRSSIALALAHVAAGRIDGFIHVGGSPIHDFAAGFVLLGEAGGVLTGLDGLDAWSSDIAVAGTTRTYNDVLACLGRVTT